MTAAVGGGARIAREVRQLAKAAAAARAGKTRGPDRKVRRESYDVDTDPRARVFRRIEDGTMVAGLAWVEDVLRLAKKFDQLHSKSKKGEHMPIQGNGHLVLEVILRKGLDFKTGQLDPAIETIKHWTGLSRKAVISALNRLSKSGFLKWVRRTQKTDNEGEYGPQRAQITNAYYFAFDELPKAVRMEFRQMRERWRRRRLGQITPLKSTAADPTPNVRVPQDPGLAAALAALGRAVEERESPIGSVSPLKGER